MDATENMELYEQARRVPEEAKRPITAGRLKGMTDINPMFRIKRLTEMFGPCGIGWWYTIKEKRIVDDDQTKQRAAFVDIDLYYKHPKTGETSMPLPGTGGSSFVAQERNGPYLSDECFKMALTDAISVAAKPLGLGADVYYQADRTKYTRLEEPTQNKPKPIKMTCDECSKVILGYDGKKGFMTPEQHIALTKKRFGKTLCVECARKASEAAQKADDGQ